MPVPKRKTSKSKTRMRRAGKGWVSTNSAKCQTCQAFLMQHSACYSCGYYRGIKVIRTKQERAHEREVAKKVIEKNIEESKARKQVEIEKQAKAQKTKTIIENTKKES